MVFIYLNIFLPVYFYNVLNVSRVELAFVQLFAYLSLFSRPLIALYYDKERSHIRLVVIISSIGMVFSFLLFIINLAILLLFGLFLALYFICSSIIRVAIEKVFVANSPDEKSKGQNSAYMQVGSISGALFPNIIAIILFSDINSVASWNLFFLIGIISILPILIIGFIIQVDIIKMEHIEQIDSIQVNKRAIVLLCSILFLIYAENIYQYPFEPWILNKVGPENLTLILIVLGVWIILNALGVILAFFISDKFNRVKSVTICSIVIGISTILFPFTDLLLLLILISVIQVCSGFLIVNVMALMNTYSQKRVLYYQVMALFAIIATVIFIPLGTYLSSFMMTEYIIAIAGIFRLISVFPILLLNREKKEQY